MPRLILKVSGVILIGAAGWGLTPRLWPVNVFRSPGSIRFELLKKTPLGTDREEVRRYLRSVHWRAELVDMHGYETAGYPAKEPASSAIIARPPGYYAPFAVDPKVVYGFDSRNRLNQIAVTKEVDAL